MSTQTQTEYLVACGAPPLPKDWHYEVKFLPDYDDKWDKWYTIIIVKIWAGDTEVTNKRYTISTKYIEQLGGKYVIDTARFAYHSLFQRPQLIPNHLTSLKTQDNDV